MLTLLQQLFSRPELGLPDPSIFYGLPSGFQVYPVAGLDDTSRKKSQATKRKKAPDLAAKANRVNAQAVLPATQYSDGSNFGSYQLDGILLSSVARATSG